MGDLHKGTKRREGEPLAIIIGETENGDLVIRSMECCLSKEIDYIG